MCLCAQGVNAKIHLQFLFASTCPALLFLSARADYAAAAYNKYIFASARSLKRVLLPLAY